MKRKFKQETLRDLSIAKYATYKANGVSDVFIAAKYDINIRTLQAWKWQYWRDIDEVQKTASEYDPLDEYLRTIQALMQEVERLTVLNEYLKINAHTNENAN